MPQRALDLFFSVGRSALPEVGTALFSSLWPSTTVVKLEGSALFGTASWRAIDETVARVDASEIRQMKKRHMSAATASSQEDPSFALEKRPRRASSTASLFNLSFANRLPLCWALPLSAILFLVSGFPLQSSAAI